MGADCFSAKTGTFRDDNNGTWSFSLNFGSIIASLNDDGWASRAKRNSLLLAEIHDQRWEISFLWFYLKSIEIQVIIASDDDVVVCLLFVIFKRRTRLMIGEGSCCLNCFLRWLCFAAPFQLRVSPAPLDSFLQFARSRFFFKLTTQSPCCCRSSLSLFYLFIIISILLLYFYWLLLLLVRVCLCVCLCVFTNFTFVRFLEFYF